MSNNPQDERFKKWLDILQQESWQLELIISGFAIYGLFMIIDPIELGNLQAQNDGNTYKIFLMQGLLVSWYILTINLIGHVILRGLWIGAIGLRYVSGEIDYDKLAYSPKFTRHLMKRVGSFDNYVATLEKYCSIIFAVTFLLVFYLLGLLAIAFLFTLLGLWIDKEDTPDWVRYGVAVPALLFLVFGLFLTFFDFITQGWLKKKKWTTWFYYPVYWIFKYITLSFLYRPMVYNFLDTKFGKRLSLIIVPLYIGITILAATGFSTSNYLEEEMSSNYYIANSDNYADLIEVNNSFADRAAIPSKVISDPYLSVFVVYGSTVEDDVFYFNEELKPEEDRRGIHSAFSDGTLSWSERRDLKDYITTVEDMYTLSIDSLAFKPEFVFSQNLQRQLGFETFLDLQKVSNGKHVLKVQRKDHRRDSVYMRTIIQIPFWYYKNNSSND
ncbi:hypothetical protein [Muriicola soli]|uniref:Uncharacterized protein n=1 Tax=Muriicola soli TaxID=2507538 RepID=A0A411EA28_9FLAO|nr:hypothetical protein [Muriicola soli]QBA64403.1 hypothetical protein EQY75_07600 [Muriicola soli]